MKKRLLLVLFLLSSLFFTTNKAIAQGTYTCHTFAVGWNTGFTCTSIGGIETCADGFVSAGCVQYSSSTARCYEVHDCISTAVANSCIHKTAVLTNCDTEWYFHEKKINCGQSCCKRNEDCPVCEGYQGLQTCGSGAFSRYPKDCSDVKQCCVDDASCINSVINLRPGAISAGNMVVGCTQGNLVGVSTALGCVVTEDINVFGGWLFSTAIYIIGAIAFLLLVTAVIQITTSTGDPKRLQAGKELISAVLSGLVFIILSIFLLKMIGYDILRLPQFSI